MVGIAQLVSAPDCGSGGPGFESLYPPYKKHLMRVRCFFTVLALWEHGPVSLRGQSIRPIAAGDFKWGYAVTFTGYLRTVTMGLEGTEKPGFRSCKHEGSMVLYIGM